MAQIFHITQEKRWINAQKVGVYTHQWTSFSSPLWGFNLPERMMG